MTMNNSLAEDTRSLFRSDRRRIYRLHLMILPSAQMKKYGGRDSFQIAKTEAFSLENGISHSLRLYF